MTFNNASQNAEALPIRFGRYEAFLKIGSGGMAKVYLAVQRGPFDAKKLVVIKQLRENVTEDPQVLGMFVNEAQIALRLNHPNVVHTYEVVAEAPDYFLAMEFLDGQSLMQVIRRVGRPNMPLEEHLWVLTQVLAGLHYAHELRDFDGSPLGIVHRDISPSNVVLTYNGEVKVVDFGIAKAMGAFSQTQQGVMKGKLGYAAPEQCLGKPADRRSDIYAVGVMLWEAMARRRRTVAETWPAMLHARLQNTEPPIEQVWPDAPAELVEICHRALQPDAQARYPSALAFQRDLERYLGKLDREVNADSLAALMRPRFEAERLGMHRAIDGHIMRSSSGSVVAALPMVNVPITDPTERSRSVSGAIPLSVRKLPYLSGTSSEEENTSPIPVDDALLIASKLDVPMGTSRSVGPNTTSSPAPQARRPRLWAWALLGAALTGGAGMLVMSLQNRDKPGAEAPRAGAPLANTAPTAATAAVPVTATSTAAQLAPGQVRLRITASPAESIIYLDGQRLDGNPFVGSYIRDDHDHELRITADYHRDVRRIIRLDENLNLELTLDPLRSGRPARAVRAVRTPSAGRPTTEAPSAAPQIEPGMDLRSRSSERPKRSIDEKDPYAQ